MAAFETGPLFFFLSRRVDYLNAAGSFLSPNTIKAKPPKGEEEVIKGKNFVIAVGGRPQYPRIEGAVECCITSDDVFSLKTPPGKTLVVGGGCESTDLVLFNPVYLFPAQLFLPTGAICDTELWTKRYKKRWLSDKNKVLMSMERPGLHLLKST